LLFVVFGKLFGQEEAVLGEFPFDLIIVMVWGTDLGDQLSSLFYLLDVLSVLEEFVSALKILGGIVPRRLGSGVFGRS